MTPHRNHTPDRGPVWAKRAAPGDWVLWARCRDPRAEPALFDATDDGTPSTSTTERARVREAKSFCRHCPVLSQCREFALDNGLVGVWGGEYFPIKNGGPKR